MTQTRILRHPLKVDLTDPIAVVQAIFDAAQSGDFSQLSLLCDPEGENDGDTRDICLVSEDEELQDLFVEFFANGKVAGEATFRRFNSEATVPILFGPDGRSRRRDGVGET